MSVTFEEARRIADAEMRQTWAPDDGTFVVSPYGWEDATHWRVEAGAREYLVDGNPDFEPLDGQVLLVDKETGALERIPVIPNFDRLGAMRPVGEHPDD